MALLKVFSLTPLTLATGVPQPLNPTFLASAAITLQADPNNTGSIYIGGAGVTSSSGLQLSAGDTATIEPPALAGRQEDMDISSIYAVTTTNGSILRIVIMRRD